MEEVSDTKINKKSKSKIALKYKKFENTLHKNRTIYLVIYEKNFSYFLVIHK